MKHKLDGAGVGKHANQRTMVESFAALGSLTPEVADAAVSEDIRWTKADRKLSTKSRHERISTLAYYLAEARGFEPGHEEEDWSLAQLEIDAVDSGVSQGFDS